jgi:tyrosine-protein kinase Etk/Wzc
MTEELVNANRNKSSISFKELIYKYIPYLPWVILSVSICLLCAYLVLRYSTPIYRASGRMLLKKQSMNNTRDRFDDIFMAQGTANLSDEIEQMRSTSMALRVVKALGLQISYYNKGNIRTSRMHRFESPIRLNVVSLPDSLSSYSLQINVLDDKNSFTLEGTANKKYYFGQQINVNKAVFTIEKGYVPVESYLSKIFIANYQPAEQLAKGLGQSVNIAQSSDMSNVLTVSFDNQNPRLAMDLTNGFMKAYEESNLEDKRQIASNTLAFIDDQLNALRSDLGGVERNLQNFREKSRALNVDVQSMLSLNKANTIEDQTTDLDVKLKVIDYLLLYINNASNTFKMVPSTLGINEPTLVQAVTEYNKLQVQRETSLQTIPPSNPVILNLDATIEKLRSDIIENLNNVRQSYTVMQDKLQQRTQSTESNLTTIPGKEKRLLEITRQQKILEELYSYLLQKKLETSIASASTVSNIKIIEPSDYSFTPIAPNRRTAYVLAIFIGVGLPVGIIFLKELLNDKVSSKNDIEKNTQTPILGEVGHSENSSTLIVTRNNRQYLAEQFRIVRSNLQYILPKVEKPVLLVTSSYSGEGKSFVSTNLGAVLALSGKRTVILEFDIRKPKIMKGLGLNERKGITNYIVGNVDLQELISPVPEIENLFVIPCGPVPPNPAEMLLNEKIAQLFKELRNRFDAIIIDTAPVGLVSDAITLGKYADSVIYIVRHGYTLKKQILLIEDLYQHQKLPNLSIIINDIPVQGGYGGYYGYGGYGYGYGYGMGLNGSGNGYFENGSSIRKGWRKWVPVRQKKKSDKVKR